MKISVLGTGCATCKRLNETVKWVVENNHINATVEYSDDVTRIVELGLMRSPVLVIDGKVVDLKSDSEKEITVTILNYISENN